MNGICHEIHMEDGDAQLSTPAQQYDSDLSVLLRPLQAKDGEPQPYPTKQQRGHSDAS